MPPCTTDMQLADELIRQEMITMLQYDAIMNAVPAPENVSVDKPETLEKYIQNYTHEDFTDKEMADARQLLANEMDTMKGERTHGPVTLGAFTEVWEEWLPAFSYSPGLKLQDNNMNKDYRIALAKKTFHMNRKSCGLKRSECKKKELSVQEETFGFRVSISGMSLSFQWTPCNTITYISFECSFYTFRFRFVRRCFANDFNEFPEKSKKKKKN